MRDCDGGPVFAEWIEVSDGEIELMRQRIRETDDRILKLVADRMKEAEAIGRLKRTHSVPLRDYTVEARVISHAEELCEKMGVEKQIGREIAKLLISASLSVQSSSDIKVYNGQKKRILVVGGNGKMGLWYSRFFNVQGHDVVVNDPRGGSPYKTENDLGKAALEADVVLLSTPISATSSVLSEVISTGTSALIMDGCSLKSPLIGELKRGVSLGMKIASIHPMFGPGAKTLAEQNMIVCDCGNPAAVDEATSLFSDTCLSIRRLDIDKHDELMVYVLGMTHAMNIVLFNALASSGRSSSELSEFASTTFRKQMQTTVDVAGENPLLYYEIQNLNRHREMVFHSLEQSLSELKRASFSRSSAEFVSMVERGREYFGGPGNGQA